jgi:hypothetical protein
VSVSDASLPEADEVQEPPVLDEMPRGRSGGPVTVYDRRPRHSRRTVLAGSARLGAFLGLTMLGFFRSVRRAAADAPYSAHSSCGRYDPDYWNGFDGDNNGFFEPGTCDDDVCIGASDDAMGSWYCVTCDEVGPQNPYGWHFSGVRGPFVYGDATDVCAPNGTGVSPRDAWKWQVSVCNDCEPALFRCHDGWKLTPSGDLSATVCQGLVECNGSIYSPC